jgi:hypothetical protein
MLTQTWGGLGIQLVMEIFADLSHLHTFLQVLHDPIQRL